MRASETESRIGKGGWAMILRGIIAVIFGLIALRYPGSAARAFVIVFALFAFADAILDFFVASTLGRAGMRWGWYAFAALVSIAAGVVALAYPQITFYALVFLVALRAIIMGATEVGAAFAWRDLRGDRWLLGLAGLLSVVFGILLFAFPAAGGLAVIYTIGIYAIVLGVAIGLIGVRLLRAARDIPRLHAPVAA
jgi:uncharacterized membrane protein HdeD (DUF308 family)